MERYKIIKSIGKGTYGVVYKATNIKNGEIVAIKTMESSFKSWDECMSLREIKSLRKLNHQNIIKLKEVIKVKKQDIYKLYCSYKQSGKAIPEEIIKSLVYQIANGLAYMHKNGFFHRDLKPENLLVQKDVLKICDFGLAREIRSRPPYTDYISTRWYRAPEILLKAGNYNSPVDIFALGCIMAELYLLAPLFSGNSELDQIKKIAHVLGTPNSSIWPDGLKLASKLGFSFPNCNSIDLRKIITNASEDAIQLMEEMLRYDPQRRPSANQVLQHKYFQGISIDRSIAEGRKFSRIGRLLSREKQEDEDVKMPKIDPKRISKNFKFFDQKKDAILESLQNDSNKLPWMKKKDEHDIFQGIRGTQKENEDDRTNAFLNKNARKSKLEEWPKSINVIKKNPMGELFNNLNKGDFNTNNIKLDKIEPNKNKIDYTINDLSNKIDYNYNYKNKENKEIDEINSIIGKYDFKKKKNIENEVNKFAFLKEKTPEKMTNVLLNKEKYYKGENLENNRILDEISNRNAYVLSKYGINRNQFKSVPPKMNVDKDFDSMKNKYALGGKGLNLNNDMFAKYKF